MKKLLFLMMALMVAPAMATVTFEIVDNGDTTADLVVTVTGGDLNAQNDSKVAGIALDVTTNSGNILSVTNFMTTGESVDGTEGYGIFMGTVTFTGDPCEIDDVGTPVAPATAPDTPGQLPGDNFTLEFACLFDTSDALHPGAPLAVTTLCTFTVAEAGTTITLTADDTRSGVVVLGGGNPNGTNLPYTGPVITGFLVDEDFGDAPNAPYPTLLANNGARHVIGGPFLGPAGDEPDAELDGQPNAGATGDDIDLAGASGGDDENGVTVGTLTAGVDGTVTFEVNGPGGPYQVDGWIDFNADGDWDDAGEKIVNGSYAVGIHAPTFAVPSELGGAAIGTTYVRFRINTGGALGPDGPADDGEVEDHAVAIEAICVGDTNGNGYIYTDDLTAMVTYLTTLAGDGFYCAGADPRFDARMDVNKNGYIYTDDLTAMVNVLTPLAGAGFYAPCP